jgi:hypothetical protein
MFLLKWHEPDVWNTATFDEAITKSGNRIPIGLPKTGKTECLRTNAGRIATIDVALNYETGKIPPVPAQATVALDHFEHGMDDRVVVKFKPSLLDDLIAAGKNILIVTTVDPVFYFENALEEPTNGKTEMA